MRKRVQRIVTWECRFCNKEHYTQRSARICWRLGIVAPRFRLGIRVRAGYGDLDEWDGIICGIALKSFYPHRHTGRIAYVICLDERLGDGYLHLFTADELQALPPHTSPLRVANVPTWRAFWKAFGRDSRPARRAVCDHLQQRQVSVQALNALSTPRFHCRKD